MRLLVLDHFFDQDIAALQAAAGDLVEWRIWPYDEVRWEALRVFPERVATGLEAFAASDLAVERARFRRVFERLLDEQFMRFPCDALVVPSDTFFYVRTAADACHRLGMPFFVAQKETTIAEHTMVEHAARVARFAPPTHDHMTVCSERHKQFWVRAGARPESITVTGQPRFDFYSHAVPGPVGRTVLFFSYHLDAYHPEEGAAPVWQAMHRETEEALAELAREGWRVLVKPHPQQPRPDLLPGLELLPAGADTRELILHADVVVGFQTTALFEAMLARKPVLYTGWDPEALRLGNALIPFGTWNRAIDVVTSGDALAEAVRRARRPDEVTMQLRRQVVADFLGPVDGAASVRTLAVISDVVQQFEATRPPAAAGLRAQLAGRRPRPRLGRKALRKLDSARELCRQVVRR